MRKKDSFGFNVDSFRIHLQQFIFAAALFLLTLSQLSATPSPTSIIIWLVCVSGYLLALRAAGTMEARWRSDYLMFTALTTLLVLGSGAAFGLLLVGLLVTLVLWRHTAAAVVRHTAVVFAGLVSAIVVYNGVLRQSVPITSQDIDYVPLFIALGSVLLTTVLLAWLLVEKQPIGLRIHGEVALLVLPVLMVLIYTHIGSVAYVITMGIMGLQMFRIRRNIGRVHADLEQRIQELSLLNAIGQQVSRHLSVDDVASSAYETLQSVVPSMQFFIALCDSDSRMVRFPLVMQQGKQLHWPMRHLDDVVFVAQAITAPQLLLTTYGANPAFDPFFANSPDDAAKVIQTSATPAADVSATQDLAAWTVAFRATILMPYPLCCC